MVTPDVDKSGDHKEVAGSGGHGEKRVALLFREVRKALIEKGTFKHRN